jgi:MFS family permease
LFAALYFSEGAPIGYIWWALPTRLAAAGMDASAITAFVAPLVLPWSLKFLWAPLVDSLQGERWGLRAWIIAAQTAMGLTLLPAFWLSVDHDYRLLAYVYLAHAVMAATQDVAVDALCVRSTPRGELAGINGWMQVGYLTSRAIFGGGVLYFEQQVLIGRWGMTAHAAEQLVLGALLVCVWCSMLLVILGCREPERTVSAPTAMVGGFVRKVREVFARASTWVGLGFAVVGGAGFEAVGAVARPLLVDEGVSAGSVGIFTIGNVVAMGVGALVGGQVADRVGRLRIVGWLTVLIAIDVVAAAGAVAVGELALTWIVLTGLYVLIGAFTASSYALFMHLTDPDLGGTQFSAFMAATNVCESWSTYAVGRLILGLGYASSFCVMAAVSLLALPLIGRLSRDEKQSSFTAEVNG